ncbi:hypothetical protein Tco_1488287, partial [Tanacetum coccineum]
MGRLMRDSLLGSGPEWLFDIDTLTKSMNYKPIVAGNQTNGNTCTKESIDAGQVRKKRVPSHEYILQPLWTPDSPISSSLKSSEDKVADDVEKKSIKDPIKEDDKDDQDLREMRLCIRRGEASNDLPLSRVNTLGSGEDSMKLQELMDLCTKLSERVLSLENIKTAQELEITNLKKRVKKLEKKKKSRTLQLKKRLFKVRIESSAKKSLEGAETQGRYGHDISTAKVTTASVPTDMDVSTASPIRPVDDSITNDITLAETLMKIKSSASRS